MPQLTTKGIFTDNVPHHTTTSTIFDETDVTDTPINVQNHCSYAS